jgi:uncharacterized protein (TIGR00369 family)
VRCGSRQGRAGTATSVKVMPDADQDYETEPPRRRTISWADPAMSAKAACASHGIEFVRQLMRGELPAPPVFELLDFRLVGVEPGDGACEFRPAEYYNPTGGVHGGAVSTLLDSVMGLAVHTGLPVCCQFATLGLKVNFVRAISTNTTPLRAEGKIVHPGARIATAEARLVDSKGALYEHDTTTCMIVRDAR